MAAARKALLACALALLCASAVLGTNTGTLPRVFTKNFQAAAVSFSQGTSSNNAITGTGTVSVVDTCNFALTLAVSSTTVVNGKAFTDPSLFNSAVWSDSNGIRLSINSFDWIPNQAGTGFVSSVVGGYDTRYTLPDGATFYLQLTVLGSSQVAIFKVNP